MQTEPQHLTIEQRPGQVKPTPEREEWLDRFTAEQYRLNRQRSRYEGAVWEYTQRRLGHR